jgi:hypothetical protein
MSNPKTIDPQAILAIVQQRFPREYEICLQQAYIGNLESALEEKDSDEADD